MPFISKPQIVRDIGFSGGKTVFTPIPRRLHLTYKKPYFVFSPRFYQLASFSFFILAWIFLIGSVGAPTIQESSHMAYAQASTSQEERQALESQLQELENQIDQYENQIADYKKQGNTLSGAVSRLTNLIAIAKLQINSANLKLEELNKNMAQTETQIDITKNKIDFNEEALAKLIRNIYLTDQDSDIELFLKHESLSELFGSIHNNELVQNNLRGTITEIVRLQGQLKDHREELALAKQDTETLRLLQLQKQKEADETKKRTNELLQQTKGQEKKYQELLQVTKKTAAQIRSRIFELLGGGELTFEQAYQFAKVASDATGVRPAFILAILDRESALGKNVGKCTYQQAMNPKDQVVFLPLLASLNIDPASVQVSCANADGAYGGAMGPAQFIPTTWVAYQSKISAITGHNPPSPWNNSDAFVAAGLYLKDAGAQTNERTAAARYYCGGRWNRYVCLNVYGAKVVQQAAAFQDDIDEILK